MRRFFHHRRQIRAWRMTGDEMYHMEKHEMYFPIFSKRHHKLLEEKRETLLLNQSVRRRIFLAMKELNWSTHPLQKNGVYFRRSILTDTGQELSDYHGRNICRTDDPEKYEVCMKEDMENLIMNGPAEHVFDAIETYARKSHRKQEFHEMVNNALAHFQCPWILHNNMMFRVESEYFAELLCSASDLLSSARFSGAFEEFQKARSHLASGDTKESIHHANLALESTMKTILGKERGKPGELFTWIKNSGIVPQYYDKFLDSFEQVLMTVNRARNEVKGAGHGQGAKVSQVPHALAELVLNLCGALIVYLVRQHLETTERKQP